MVSNYAQMQTHAYAYDVIKVINDMRKQEGMPNRINSVTYITNKRLQIYLQTIISTMTTVVHPTLIGTCVRNLKRI